MEVHKLTSYQILLPVCLSDQTLTDTGGLKIENAGSIQLSALAHCEYQKIPKAVFKEIPLLQLQGRQC